MPTRSIEKVNNLQSEPNLTRHKKTSKLQPKTQIKVEEAAKMITDGKGMNDVIEFIPLPSVIILAASSTLICVFG